jgi:LmbE family N-acetylglucosaminyl deacetylase
MPETMLVFAHPDDEVIALGGRLGRFGAAHLVHVTDGAPRNEQDSRAHGFASFREYRDARAAELTDALRSAGVGEMSRVCLEIADQEASFHLANLTARLLGIFRARRPEVVFTHPYEGGHPDHDACAFAVQHAARGMADEQRPLIVEAPFYHSGQGFVSGEFLLHPQKTHGVAYALMESEQRKKRRLIECFRSQRETLAGFNVDWEHYRVAPVYDFRQPPHTPPVGYDHFPWGMSSQRWCELAAQAEDALGDGLKNGPRMATA